MSTGGIARTGGVARGGGNRERGLRGVNGESLFVIVQFVLRCRFTNSRVFPWVRFTF